MVLDKIIKMKTLRKTVYILAAIIEVFGLALLFNPEKTIDFIIKNTGLVAVILSLGGYISALGARNIR